MTLHHVIASFGRGSECVKSVSRLAIEINLRKHETVAAGAPLAACCSG